jgi:hypothetical protein
MVDCDGIKMKNPKQVNGLGLYFGGAEHTSSQTA